MRGESRAVWSRRMDTHTHPAVAYAVTRGRDFAFFLVRRKASRRAVPAGIRAIWLYAYLVCQQCMAEGVRGWGF
jgi:hypothetical protein